MHALDVDLSPEKDVELSWRVTLNIRIWHSGPKIAAQGPSASVLTLCVRAPDGQFFHL